MLLKLANRILPAALVLVIVFCVGAGNIERVSSPGATGMRTSQDYDLSSPTDALVLKNVDILTHTGKIIPRGGFISTSDSQQSYVSFYGSSDNRKGYKHLLAVMPYSSGDSIYVSEDRDWYETTSPPDSGWTSWTAEYYVLKSDTCLARLVSSDSFSTIIDTSNLSPLSISNGGEIAKSGFLRPSSDVDFENYDGMTIIASLSGTPLVYTPLEWTQSTDSFADTIGYKQRVLPLRIPAPGEPKVFVMGEGSPGVDSRVEYFYTYTNYGKDETALTFSDMSDSSIHSIEVRPRNQNVMITGFLNRPMGPGDVDQKGFPLVTRFHVWRKDLTTGNYSCIAKYVWKQYNKPVTVIDSGQALYSGYDYSQHNDTMASPGRIFLDCIVNSLDLVDADQKAWPDSTYYYRWSWYDPETGLESPYGPMLGIKACATNVSDTNVYRYTLGYLADNQAPTTHIRIYQSVANDSSAFYGYLQLRVGNWRTSADGNRFYTGILSDTALTSGLGFERINIDSNWQYTDNAMVLADDGGPQMRPPVVSPCFTPLSDIEYANGRLWGIGDPLYPQRLYYSNYNEWGDWDAFGYFTVDEYESDKLVALSIIPGQDGDAIVAFKKKSVYVASGYDADYDMNISRAIFGYGAISRRAVCSRNGVTLYMSNDKRIHSIPKSSDGKWLSEGVQNLIDTMFTNIDSVISYATVDEVCFRQAGKSPAISLCYNVYNGTFSLKSAVKPMIVGGSVDTTYKIEFGGSFLYDTIDNSNGFTGNDYWFYEAYGDGQKNYLWKRLDGIYKDSLVDSAGGGNLDMVYRSSYIVGDGSSLFECNKIDLKASGNNGDTLVCTVINESDSSLGSDTIIFDGRLNETYLVQFPAHLGLFLSIEFSGSFKEISSFTPYVRRVKNASID